MSAADTPSSDCAFDAEYRRSEGLLYGDTPVPDLVDLVNTTRLTPPGRVLDLGCGEGRNALFLARRGFEVEAVDAAPTAVKRLVQLAQGSRLTVSARVADVREIDLPEASYVLIVANTILDHLDPRDSDRLIARIQRTVRPGGYVFASVFTTNDPGHTGIGPKSATAKHVKRYFAPGELRVLFGRFSILRYREEELLDRQHDAPHWHAIARLWAQRPESGGRHLPRAVDADRRRCGPRPSHDLLPFDPDRYPEGPSRLGGPGGRRG
jgi:tellurite methyltransferase